MTREEAAEQIYGLILSAEDEDGPCIFSDQIEALETAIEVLKQPERNKGRWIDMGDHCVCDQCGHTESAQYDGVQPIPNFTPYCSMCGAKMEGEE